MIGNQHQVQLRIDDFRDLDSDVSGDEWAESLRVELEALGIGTRLASDPESVQNHGSIRIPDHVFDDCPADKSCRLKVLIEQVIRQIPFEFDELPLLVEGESKIIRSFNDKIVVERFKPTVYSYTHNRYGIVEGTESLRIHFTSELFRRMNRYSATAGVRLENAFLACIETETEPLLVQRKVDSCNLEVRVKRFHTGSPVHRYRFTEQFPSNHQCGPLEPWSRFDEPVVCFDWRHPLTDGDGARLADEPISDDYASVWMKDVETAKFLARETFMWMEDLFSRASLVLVDICFFVDRSGHVLFGEISPDCMRVREQLGHPGVATSFDKDLWRKGEHGVVLAEKYDRLFQRVFNLEERVIHE